MDHIEKYIDVMVPSAVVREGGSKALLTYGTGDINCQAPDLRVIGTRLRHTGNGKVYTIIGFAWNGDTDEWNVLHVGPDGIMIVRPFEHINGRRSNGEYRYVDPQE